MCQVIIGTFIFLFDICLLLLFSVYLKCDTPWHRILDHEQNALANAFLDAVLIASNNGM